VISLRNFNTFNIDSNCEQLIQVHHQTDLPDIIKNLQQPFYILGGGSNVLLSNPIHKPILKNELKGIELIGEDDDHVIVRVASGENWHEFVQYSIENEWGGLENLSLIPGTVGAAPVQNIGAYGVEIKDSVLSVEGYDCLSEEFKSFKNVHCHFGYRSSIFKYELKDKFFITALILQLAKKHILRTDYGAIRDELLKMKVETASISDVSQAVINIRKSKLPDPKEIGNAGSFFKNSSIPQSQFDEVKKNFPDMPFYQMEKGEIKIPSGWLIEHAGWKGKRLGDAACHEKQALVLVNLGQATAKDILNLAGEIKKDVYLKFGIELEYEVNIWV
jgi:UDP-N-acetylmuramate dehydrogenase